MKLSHTSETHQASNEQREPIDEGSKNSTSLAQPTTPSHEPLLDDDDDDVFDDWCWIDDIVQYG